MYDQLKTIIRKSPKKLRVSLIKVLRRLPISSEIIGPPKGIYKSSQDWAMISTSNISKLKGSYIEVFPSHRISRSEPGRLDENVHWKFQNEHESPTTFVAVIPNGRVWSENGAVITPDDKLLADVSLDFGITVEQHPIFKQWKLLPAVKIHGTVAVLSAAGGTGYFHWFFDVLPRIELLCKSGIKLENIDKFIINSYEMSFVRETLNLLKISPDKIIEGSLYPHIKADKLLVPSLPGNTGNMPKWACDFIRDIFLKKTLSEKLGLKRIYITRSQARYRRVINEAEVISCLKLFKFDIVALESMSVFEQALLLNSAEIVVSPHGAGLSNLVFCNPGCKVIEFFSPNYVNVCYWSLSNQMNLEYYYLIGEGEKPQNYTDPHLVEEDITVNIDAFLKIFVIAGIKH